MSIDPSEKPLSPWWRHAVILVMIVRIQRAHDGHRPHLHECAADPRAGDGRGRGDLFTRENVEHGQEVFLKYGLMEHGTLWGHGAYLGPDYSAEYLHRLAEITRDALARERHGRAYAELDPDAAAGLDAGVHRLLKANRYDPRPARCSSRRPRRRRGGPRRRSGPSTSRRDARARAAREVHPRRGRARGPQLVLRLGRVGDGRQPSRQGLLLHEQLAVRAAVGNRPSGLDLPLERAQPRHAARRARGRPLRRRPVRLPRLARGHVERAGTRQRARALDAHPEPEGRRASTSASWRFCSCCRPWPAARSPTTASSPARSTASTSRSYLPYNLLRTWHLQLAIFWIATAWVAGGLFLAPIVGGAEPRGQKAGVLALLGGARRRRLRQPGRRVARHQRPPRRPVVLVRPPGLGVPRPRAVLAAAAGGRPRGLARPHVPRAASGDPRSQAGASCPRCSSTPRRPSRSSTCPRSSSAPARTSR